MYIPKKLITCRFYVAVRVTKALSSWRSLDEALVCIERFKEHAPYEFSTIKGVIKVSEAGREWVTSTALTQLLK
jgi:hypothetical protein